MSSTPVPINAFRILLTGFGPFYHYKENPSWLAVKPLHNIVITPDSLSSPITIEGKTITLDDGIGGSRPIHITAIKVPMTYEAVLDTVPGLHARPPVLPPDKTRTFFDPPVSGYDLIFHVGVAGRGPLRMERLGHKLNYHMKDASGKLATIVQSSPKDNTGADDRLVAENIERERLGMEIVETPGGENTSRPTRGFGAGYESFSDELMTEIDVLRLVHDLKRSGTEQIYTSMDAGHYLADYMYYCSLAESRRNVKPYEKKRSTQVLFMHCPPVGQPLSTEDVTEAIKRIIVWVCNELLGMDDGDDDAPAVKAGAVTNVKGPGGMVNNSKGPTGIVNNPRGPTGIVNNPKGPTGVVNNPKSPTGPKGDLKPKPV